MQSQPNARHERRGQMSESFLTAVFLSLSGGLQDAYTYFFRGKVYANAQTGNIVLLSHSLFSRQWATALSYLVPLLAFASGILVAEFTRIKLQHTRVLHWRQIIVLVEILLLFVVGFFPQRLDLLANAFVSFSCAMQLQTFRKVRGHAYASTMCIGNMRSGTDAFTHWLVDHDPKTLKKSLHYFAVILLFAVGAGLGSVAVDHFATRTIWWSCLLLAVVFVLMFVKEEIEENPAIEKDLSAIRQEADEIDALLKEELHEEHESWKDTLEHKN